MCAMRTWHRRGSALNCNHRHYYEFELFTKPKIFNKISMLEEKLWGAEYFYYLFF